MPKTLSKNDPSLIASVERLRRVQQVWGLLLLSWGAVTEAAGLPNHPVSGIPFIAIGLGCLLWREPALIAAVAALMAFSIAPGLNPRLTILGPDPVVVFGSLNLLETIAIVVGKALIVLTATNQFLLYRFLYGTARATGGDPDQPIIPAMVPNRSDGLARAARWLGLGGFALSLVALLFTFVDPSAYLPLILAEMAGSLAVIAVGVGVGTAFSPTDERRAALLAVGAGLMTYIVCTLTLVRLV
jgi:hypothetical protein